MAPPPVVKIDARIEAARDKIRADLREYILVCQDIPSNGGGDRARDLPISFLLDRLAVTQLALEGLARATQEGFEKIGTALENLGKR